MNVIDNFKITMQTCQDRLTHASIIDQTSPWLYFISCWNRSIRQILSVKDILPFTDPHQFNLTNCIEHELCSRINGEKEETSICEKTSLVSVCNVHCPWNFYSHVKHLEVFFISMFFKLKSMLTISLDVIQDRSHLLVYKIADKAIVTRHNQVKWNRIVEEI